MGHAGLSDRQKAALSMILTGATDTKVAKTIGANRKTIYRWRVQDPVFREALEEGRRKHFEHAADQMRGLLEEALKTLGRQVRDIYDPTAHRAARTLLSLARVGRYVSDQAQGTGRTSGS
jgi:hypothetical protein